MDNFEDKQVGSGSYMEKDGHVCYLQNEKHANALKRTLQPLHELAESILGEVVLGVLEWHEPSICLIFPEHSTISEQLKQEIKRQFIQQVENESLHAAFQLSFFEESGAVELHGQFLKVHDNPIIFETYSVILFNSATVLQSKYKEIQRLNKVIEAALIESKKVILQEIELSDLYNKTRPLLSAMEASEMGVWEWDMKTGALQINEMWATIIGYTAEELGELNIETWYRFSHPDDEKYSSEQFTRLLKGEIPYYDMNYRMRHKNGEWIWVNTRSKVSSWSDDGEPLRMNGIMADINKQVLTQLQLESYSNSLPAVVYRFILYEDGTQKMKFVSAGSYEIWGISPEAAMIDNSFILQRVHPDDYDDLMESVFQSQRFNRQWEFTYRYLHPDGTLRWHKGKGKPQALAKGATAWDSLVIDITESENLQQELLRQKLQTEAIINATEDWVWSMNIEGQLTTYNNAFKSAVGAFATIPIEPNSNFQNIQFPEPLKLIFNNAFKQVVETHENIELFHEIQLENSLLLKYISLNLYPIFDTSNSLAGIACYLKDISDFKKVQYQLEESNANYKLLFEFSPIPMWVYDLETLSFVMVNKAAMGKYGYTLDEFLSMTIKDIRPTSEIPKLIDVVNDSRKRNSFEFSGQFIHQKKSGEVFEVEITSTIVVIKGRKAELIAAIDLSERMRIMSKIFEQNNSLREIAWMQSHVVRAPLARMMGIVDLLVDPNLSSEELKSFCAMLDVSMKELDAIIHQITQLSKPFTEIGRGN